MNECVKVSLGSLLERVVGGGTPTRGVADYWEGNIPWVSVKDFCHNSLQLSTTTESISILGVKNSACKIIPPGVPIIAVRMAVGSMAISSKEVAINQDLKALFPKSGVNSKYLAYLLQFLKPDIDAVSIGSTVKGISVDMLKKMLVPFIASEDSQKKIVDILSCLDTNMEIFQTAISKHNLIVQGIMVDLFSRGVDPVTGCLRPSVKDAPELYKSTPLGPVPKEWDVELLRNRLKGKGVIQTGPFGSQLHAHDYTDSGVPVVMPQDLINGEISKRKISYISFEKAKTLSRHKLRNNDVIFSRRGDLTRSAYVAFDNDYQGFLCGTGCLLMRAEPETICAGWFSDLYGTRLVQRQVDGLAVGTTMANLNSSILGRLLIPFPPIQEQQQIHKLLRLVKSQIKVNMDELHKLKIQKSGLMRDLLTGKVPVSA